jgi:hypothetical protein
LHSQHHFKIYPENLEVNCHSSLLLQYCKKNDIKCDNLEYYVNNRDLVIITIVDNYQLNKEDVKQLFFKL